MLLEPINNEIFPLISPLHTSVWVEFWNTHWKSWVEAKLTAGGAGGAGDFASFALDGRLLTDPTDPFAPRKSGSAALSLVLPEGGTWVINGAPILLEEDVTLSPLNSNWTGWVEPTYEYDETFEVWNWGLISHEVRPPLGTGIAAKVVTLNDRVDTLLVTEAESDVIPTLPILLARLRTLSGGTGEVGGANPVFLDTIYLTSGDEQTGRSYVDERLDFLAAQLEKLAGPSQGKSNGMDRRLKLDVMELELEASSNNPEFSTRIDASIWIPGSSGGGYYLGNGRYSKNIHTGNTLVNEETGEES